MGKYDKKIGNAYNKLRKKVSLSQTCEFLKTSIASGENVFTSLVFLENYWNNGTVQNPRSNYYGQDFLDFIATEIIKPIIPQTSYVRIDGKIFRVIDRLSPPNGLAESFRFIIFHDVTED